MVERSWARVIALVTALLLGACSQPEESPPNRDLTDPATIVELYAEAINTRSLSDYLALHVDGFTIQRPADHRQCLPWLDDGWWEAGSAAPECVGELGDVGFGIIDQRSAPGGSVEVMLNVSVTFMVSSDSGWFTDGQIALELVSIEGALLITSVEERRVQ